MNRLRAWNAWLPWLTVLLLIVVFGEAFLSLVPVRCADWFPSASPQWILVGVAGLTSLCVVRERVLRRCLVVGLLLVFLSGSLIVRNVLLTHSSPRLGREACGLALPRLEPATRERLVLPDDEMAIPEVRVAWTGDVTCDWGASVPADAADEASFTVTAWEINRARFAAQAL